MTRMGNSYVSLTKFVLNASSQVYEKRAIESYIIYTQIFLDALIKMQDFKIILLYFFQYALS